MKLYEFKVEDESWYPSPVKTLLRNRRFKGDTVNNNIYTLLA